VANVDEAIAQLVSKVNQGGFDKIFAELQRQVPIYIAGLNS